MEAALSPLTDEAESSGKLTPCPEMTRLCWFEGDGRLLTLRDGRSHVCPVRLCMGEEAGVRLNRHPSSFVARGRSHP